MNLLEGARPGRPEWGGVLANVYPAQPTNPPVSVPGTAPPVQAGVYFPVPGPAGPPAPAEDIVDHDLIVSALLSI